GCADLANCMPIAQQTCRPIGLQHWALKRRELILVLELKSLVHTLMDKSIYRLKPLPHGKIAS
ncbi:Hypothetical predicted protein, partial [Marmota monax]